MWFTLVSIFYVLVCVFLILVVLLQQGKGGGMGSAFGGSTQTVFGGAGAGNFLTRLTAIAATMFMVLSAVLAYMSSSGDRVLDVAQQIEAAQRETTIGGEGGETSEPPSIDTLDDAANDVVLDALEEAARQQAGEAPAPDEGGDEDTEPRDEGTAPFEDVLIEEEPAAEEPAAPTPAAAPAEPEGIIEAAAPGAATRPARPAPAAPPPARPVRPRPAPAAEGEAAPAEAAPRPAPAAPADGE